jgi:hypothetical protein
MSQAENSRIQRLENADVQLEAQLETMSRSIHDVELGMARVEGALPVGNPASPGWTKLASIAAAVSCVAAIVSGVYGAYQARETKLSTQGQVVKLQADLRMVTAVVAPQLLGQVSQVVVAAAALPSGEVPEALRQASAILSDLRNNNIQVREDELRQPREATSNLIKAHPDVPPVWAAAAQFASYSSEITNRRSHNRVLPNCRDLQPRGNVQLTQGSTSVKVLRPPTVSDFVIVLDDPANWDWMSNQLSALNLQFENCEVVYNGGAIALRAMPFKGMTIGDQWIPAGTSIPTELRGQVIFTHCVFSMTFTTVPGPSGKQITDNLLRASGEPVTLNLLSNGL